MGRPSCPILVYRMRSSFSQLPSTSGLETCAGDVNAPVVSVLASERMFSQRLMRLRLRVIGGEIMLK